MGRLCEKRPAPPLDKDAIAPNLLLSLAQQQETGEVYYGEWVYPVSQRARAADHNFAVALAHLQQGAIRTDPRVFGPKELRPPEAAQPPARPAVDALQHQLAMQQAQQAQQRPSSANGSSSAAPEFSEEESKIVLQARDLGKSWNEIARMVGRSSTALRRHFQIPLKPKSGNKAGMSKKVPQAPQAAAPAPPTAGPAVAVAAQIAAMQPRSASGPLDAKDPTRAAPAATQTATVAQAGVLHTEVNPRRLDRAGGDARVKLSRPLAQPPDGFTGLAAHKGSSLEGWKFFGRVVVVDADDPDHTYRFDLDEPAHGACFNVGMGPDGSPLISWSDLHALYQMPDGTKWAEHGYFHDREDLDELCRKAGRTGHSIVPKAAHKHELFKRHGRFHSRLQNIEYECWVFPDRMPPAKELQGINEDDVYFWRTMFDSRTMEVVTAIRQ